MAGTIGEMLWELGDNYPTSDIEANTLLKLLKEDKKESDRLLDMVKKEIEAMEAQGLKIESEHKEKYDKVVSKLGQYLTEEVDDDSIKDTATTKKYKLLAGEIVLNKPKVSIAKPTSDDEVKLMNLYPNLIKVETKLNWVELKKRLVVGEDRKVKDKETGLDVPVPTLETEENFTVKL